MVDIDEDETPAGGSSQYAAALGATGSDKRVGAAGGQTQDPGDVSSPKPISADMQQFIGRQLRAVFDDVAKQPVPDRFLELMKQLDNKSRGR